MTFDLLIEYRFKGQKSISHAKLVPWKSDCKFTFSSSLSLSLSQKVTSLIGAHSDIFAAILKSQRVSVTVATLEELSLVTGVIGHSGVGQDWSEQGSTALGSGMMHIQRLMLAHIPQYCNRQVRGEV